MTQQAILFGSTASLVGVVTEPESPIPKRPAFTFLNAGGTHHVGPNQLHVRLARELADDGFTSLRYDCSGLGDSAARMDDMTAWESVVVETREAMDHLRDTRGIEQFVLIGICSGAASSYVTARADPRVVGCEGDEGLDYLHVILGDGVRDAACDENSRFEVIRGSNHMFTLQWSQDRLAELVREWAQVYSEYASRPEPATP